MRRIRPPLPRPSAPAGRVPEPGPPSLQLPPPHALHAAALQICAQNRCQCRAQPFQRRPLHLHHPHHPRRQLQRRVRALARRTPASTTGREPRRAAARSTATAACGSGASACSARRPALRKLPLLPAETGSQPLLQRLQQLTMLLPQIQQQWSWLGSQGRMMQQQRSLGAQKWVHTPCGMQIRWQCAQCRQ